jgi:integrase
MRQGELLGLKWSDMDWGNQTLSVSRSLSQLKTGEYVFNPPKTKAGRRQIDLGSVSTEVLRTHHRNQYLESVSQPGWNAEDLIFPSKAGKPMDPGNLRRMYKNLLKSAGLPNIRFHDLRHTAATLMLNNGIPVLIVSRRLGHAKPSITLDIYGHLIPGQQKIVASLMDELLTPIQLQLQN